MDLEKYLKRIAYSGPIRRDRATLNGLVAAHLQSVAFENLDQQMGVPVSDDPDHAYEKVVLQGRGGWCFELNGLFRWLLQNIGYEVSMLAGYVGEEKPTTGQQPDHMLLRVDCDGPLLVDVGFGGGMHAPMPLSPGTVLQSPYRISLTAESDGFFRYTESAAGDEACYWFTLENAEPGVFEPASQRLQADTNSPFLRTLTAQRRYSGRHVVLRGLVKKTIGSVGTSDETLPTPKALVDCLRRDFDLVVPQIATCWPKLRQRHADLFER